MQQQLHENPAYGVASVHYAPLVAKFVVAGQVSELLDYGAGKGRLAQELAARVPWPLRVHCYDPAVPRWSTPPEPCDFVVCVDVLEHIELELLPNVLDDLARVTTGNGLLTVHTGPATKSLPDGRNAHLVQQPSRWWLPQIMERFELLQFSRMAEGFWVVVEARST